MSDVDSPDHSLLSRELFGDAERTTESGDGDRRTAVSDWRDLLLAVLARAVSP